MADASGIRAGGAYVEVRLDSRGLATGLQESTGRLKRWVSENSGQALGGKGFFAGGLGGAELAETGLRFATAIVAAKVAMAGFRMAAAAARGDMEAIRAAGESLPLVGGFVSPGGAWADQKMKDLTNWFNKNLFGGKGDVFGLSLQDKGAENRRAIETKQLVEYQRAMVRAKQDYTKTVFGPKLGRLAELQEQVDQGKLLQSQAREILATELKTLNTKEGMVAADKARIVQEEAAEVRARLREREAEAAVTRRTKVGEDIASALDRVRAETRRAAGDTGTADEEEAIRRLRQEAAAAGVPVEELERRLLRLRDAFAGLRTAEKGAALREEARALAESLQTPAERGKAEVGRAKELLEGGSIGSETFRRAVNRALEGAAGEVQRVLGRTQVAGSANPFALRALQFVGIESVREATQATAKNTAELVRLARDWGVVYQP